MSVGAIGSLLSAQSRKVELKEGLRFPASGPGRARAWVPDLKQKLCVLG